MKLLQSIMIILFFSLFTTWENHAQAPGQGRSAQPDDDPAYQSTPNNSPLEMKPLTDPKTGRVTSYLPLPADWKIVHTPSGMQGIEGPNEIRVHFMPSETYFYNIDPYVAQMAGKAVANPISIEAVFSDRIVPAFEQQGGKLLRQYALEDVAQRSRQLIQQVLNRSQIQSYQIIASEWEQPSGNKSLILLSQGIMQSEGGGSWWIGLTEVEAPVPHFAQAKETYLFAQENWQPDIQAAMAHAAELNRIDRESNERMARSRAAHEAKMRSNEAAFQARQEIHRSTVNDLNDMSMRGYWSRSEIQDRMRNRETNMIHEEYTVTNPWDNRPLQVQSGYKQYYINAQGDVIGSNDLSFDPNLHRDYNHTEWKKMPYKQ